MLKALGLLAALVLAAPTFASTLVCDVNTPMASVQMRCDNFGSGQGGCFSYMKDMKSEVDWTLSFEQHADGIFFEWGKNGYNDSSVISPEMDYTFSFPRETETFTVYCALN